jgi:enoyl-CoA hydratase/carnithine racemase
LAGLPRIGQPGLFFRDKCAVEGQSAAMFRLTRDGEVARVLLDRPEARNAIPAAAWAELARTLAEAASARLLVVSGAGGAFCAGADLADFAAMRGDEAACQRFRQDMRSAIDALAALPIPTIAKIDGPCFGAGVALAMACDLRIAGPVARFAITPAKIGISFPQEDVHRLVALVGPAQASRLLFTAATIGAAEAARIGLADSEDIDEAALIANDPVSLTELKRAIALTVRGVRTDPEQDRRFDALIGGEALQRRLEALRRK